MEQALFCNACGHQITGWLRPILAPSDAARLCRFDEDGGMAPIPPGYVLMIDDKMLRDLADKVSGIAASPASWLSLTDLTEGVGYWPLPGRRNGCCGLDGMDGPNRICRCGAEIGTEQSDCWTWHIFTPLSQNTTWKKHDD